MSNQQPSNQVCNPNALLIKNAELIDSNENLSITDVRVAEGQIENLGNLTPRQHETVVDARGGLLVPGLNDHHVHLVSYAASLTSVNCGPPRVKSAEDLIEVLNRPGEGWLRGTHFFEETVPELDKTWLDRYGPARPIRIQHRSGRLWILNSLGLAEIQNRASSLASHEAEQLNQADGRLFDVDALISSVTRSQAPPMAEASSKLAAMGVTGLNDMTPSNDGNTHRWFDDLQQRGELHQKIRLSGRSDLAQCASSDRLQIGETKVHLHAASLPDIDEFIERIRSSHSQGRGVAVHCVTEVELIFTLSAFETAGCLSGDRIEHGSIIPLPVIPLIQDLGLWIVTQPNFIKERGDDYLSYVSSADLDNLYRTRSLQDANIPVAFGTDLPFGAPDPWAAMQAAVERQTSSGQRLGGNERLTPERALYGYLGHLDSPCTPRNVEPGATADLCLLDSSWHKVRNQLSGAHVRMTLRDGQVIYQLGDLTG